MTLVLLNANIKFKLIIKCVYSLDILMLIRACKTYVKPLLEYGSPVWSLYGIGDVRAIENVQRSFTRKYYMFAIN